MDLHISGLFYYVDNNKGMWGFYPAAEMALEYVNNRTDILADYTIVMDDVSVTSAGLANKVLMEQIFEGPQLYMVFGPLVSSIAEVVSQTAPLYNLIQVSPSVTSADLSNTDKYPMLFRTVQSDNTNNPARIALLQHFGWNVLGTISKDDDLFTSVMQEFSTLLDSFNMTALAATTYRTDPTSQVNQLKTADARIIVAMNYGPAVLCAAYLAGMYGHKYQWFLTGGQGDEFFLYESENFGCSEADMYEIVEGAIVTDHSYYGEDDERAISGHTPGEFKAEMYERLDRIYGLDYFSTYSSGSFDAVWAIALALNSSIQALPQNKTLENFTYQDTEMAEIFKDQLTKTHFTGVSGPIHFTEKGDRLGRVIIYQIQDGKFVEVGIFDDYKDEIEWNEEHPMRWHGGHPPVDSVSEQSITIGLSPEGFIAMATTSSLGMCGCIFFLWFNVQYRSHRFIKMSSPRLNNLMILGCLLTYLSVILVGMDSNTLDEDQLATVCNLRIWIMVVGFTLAFGSMFSKTWRVHVLFTNKKYERKVVKDGHLFAMVGGFLAIDGAILTIWMVLDSQKVVLRFFPPEEHPTEDDIILIPRFLACESVHNMKWLVTIYAFKGILVLFGIFLAWETRKVQIPGLNDSKQIGFCVYNVMVMSVLTITISNVLDDRQADIRYCMVASCIILCNTATLGLVFVPKVWAIHRNSVEDMNISTQLQPTTEATVNNEVDIQKFKAEIVRLKVHVDHLQHLLREKTSGDCESSIQPDAVTTTTTR
ncbi:gamma-aminobutyric acid type B receptor subunit 2-like [Glandiceps talaboti]